MDTRTDVLILTAQYGQGHMSVSYAIKQKIRQQKASAVITIQDFFEMTKPNSYKGMYKRYEYLVKHGSWIYNYYYYSKEKSKSVKKLDTISLMIQKRFNKYMREVQPKVVISTFPICSGYMSKYKENTNSDIPLVTVITDIVSTSEWIYPFTDLYCVATSEIKDNLIQKGVPEDKIAVTGIPIRDSFHKEKKRYDLEMVRALPRDTKLITFMGGGLGLLPNGEEIYDWLSNIPNVHAVIITGNNKKLYEKLSKLQHDNITVLGYTHTMDEIMRRSDLFIGKPGGITIFEAIMTNVPCVILKPSLGQEIENCKYLQKKGIGFVVEDINELKEIIVKLLMNEDLLSKSYKSLEEIRKAINPELLATKIREFIGD